VSWDWSAVLARPVVRVTSQVPAGRSVLMRLSDEGRGWPCLEDHDQSLLLLLLLMMMTAEVAGTIILMS